MSSAGPPRSTRGKARTMRVATVGDIHCKKASQGAFQALFGAMAAAADVLALCGDLTDYGLAEEARVLVKELAAARTTPIVAVLGNHDYESGEVDQVKAILDGAGAHRRAGGRHPRARTRLQRVPAASAEGGSRESALSADRPGPRARLIQRVARRRLGRASSVRPD